MKKLLASLLAAGLLTACAPSSESSQTPTPTGPVATPAASTSSPDPAQDPTYLEAVRVYKAYFAQMQKMESANFPSPDWPKAWDQWITGTMKEAIANNIRESHALRGESDVRGASKLIGPVPNVGVLMGDSDVSLQLCSDSTGIELLDPGSGSVIGQGPMVYKEVFFKRVNGRLKGFVQKTRVVEKCPV